MVHIIVHKVGRNPAKQQNKFLYLCWSYRWFSYTWPKVLSKYMVYNFMISDSSNRRTIFPFSSLQIMNHVFGNPANENYIWIGAEDSNIAILQNFRMSNGLIYLIELSPCLERKLVKLASLKKQFSMYLCVRFKATK